MPQTGIVNASNIIKAIKQQYGYDFSNYLSTSFRYAIDKSIQLHRVKYPELLQSRIVEEEDFFEEFLFEITDNAIEIFRDPELWNLLKSGIMTDFLSGQRAQKIWLPDASNGQDLFSLQILLKTAFPSEQTTIEVSSISIKTLEKISNGHVSRKHLEASAENLERVFPSADIYSFFKKNGDNYIIDPAFLKNVTFTKQDMNFVPSPENPGMIIFRNGLLKYIPEYQIKILETLSATMHSGAILIIGLKENIEDYIAQFHDLQRISRNEKIYKKVLNP